ncbi:hypothetical protein ACFL42_04965, partial [Candidatus Omnitrophota bacterium]
MKKLTYIFLGLLIAITMVATNAQAYTLVSGGPGLPGFYGVEHFNFVGTGSNTVNADVFFAVFGPGDTDSPISTTVESGLYTYAYLVAVNPGSVPVSMFTVGHTATGSAANATSIDVANDALDIWASDGLAPSGAPSPF